MRNKILVKVLAIVVMIIGLSMLYGSFALCKSIVDIASAHGSALQLFGYLIALIFLSVYGLLCCIGSGCIIFEEK